MEGGSGSDKHARGAAAVFVETAQALSVRYTKWVKRVVPHKLRPRHRWQIVDARAYLSLSRGHFQQPVTLVLRRAHLAYRG